MSTPYQARKIAAPTANVENKPFLDAAAQGRLLYGHCNDCGEAHYYPRLICPFCHRSSVAWKEASGEGRIYTYSVLRRASPGPYAIAYVILAEGPTVLTNIVDCDLDSIHIDQKVRVVFKPTEGGQPIPMFAPA